MNNQTFFRKLKTESVNYLLCDLHVHSIASADVLHNDRFNVLDTEEKEIINSLSIDRKNYADKWQKYEDIILEKVSIEDYFSFIERHRNKVTKTCGLSGNSDDWAIIAITDHNTCRFSCELSRYSWANKIDKRIIMLPGIELEVDFKIKNTTEEAKVHICLIFAPNTTASQIHTALNIALPEHSKQKWNYGDTIQTDNLDSLILSLRHNSAYPAITVAAHVSGSKGVRHEVLEVLKRSQAEYITTTAEYDKSIEEDASFAKSNAGNRIKQRLTELKKIIGSDNINLEVLRMLGKCGFDALQVSDLKDDKHYRCLHRFNEDFGRAVPILCSDAHSVNKIFSCDNNLIPYVKYPSFKNSITPNSFHRLLRDYSLRFGETRFTTIPKDRMSCYIKGIEISPESDESKKFWPFKENSFYLSFSSDLNCLIGGRGSGKSAMIEAIAFLFDQYDDAFNEQAKLRDNDQKDWYKRARSTLAGCNVKICWSSTNEEYSTLKKRALFLERYFDLGQKYDEVAYSDFEEEQVIDGDIINWCDVDLYRMSQLEELAVDEEKMRALFDDICGYEVDSLGEKIEEVVEELTKQESDIIDSFGRLAELTKENSPLRTYVIRKVQYDKVNSEEFKEKYDKLDKAMKAKRVATSIKKDWQDVVELVGIEEIKGALEEFFEGIQNMIGDDEGNVFEGLESFQEMLLKEEDEDSLKQELEEGLRVFEEKIKEMTGSVESIENELIQEETQERSQLQKEGIPVGAKERESKKRRYDEAEEALLDYREEIKNLKGLLKARKTLFSDLKEFAESRTNLRTDTGKKITDELKRSLDSTILVIEADAQAMADKNEFIDWLDKNFFPEGTRYKEKKIEQLLLNGLTPEKLKSKLLKNKGASEIKNDIDKSSAGRITLEEAEKFIGYASVGFIYSYNNDITEHSAEKIDLPETIQKGILVCTEDENRVQAYLELDRIVFDDIPEIRLMDRPNEMQHARLITELSPGQRCSAILPIILLNGNTPLIIDQPEDNLDNRLIREVVVNILATMKLKRQIIIATHNPNLPVLGDVEQAIILRATEQDKCQLQAIGDIENDNVVNSITDIMEGGREAFQYRQSIYQTHWKGPVQEKG